MPAPAHCTPLHAKLSYTRPVYISLKSCSMEVEMVRLATTLIFYYSWTWDLFPCCQVLRSPLQHIEMWWCAGDVSNPYQCSRPCAHVCRFRLIHRFCVYLSWRGVSFTDWHEPGEMARLENMCLAGVSTGLHLGTMLKWRKKVWESSSCKSSLVSTLMYMKKIC